MTSLLSSRRGMEFAIGTVVVLILGIAIVAGGVVLLRQIIDAAQDPLEDMDAHARDELRRLAGEGKLVAIWPSHRDAPPGERIPFGGIVQNSLATAQTFSIDVTGKDATDTPLPAAWKLSYYPTLDVAQGALQEFVVVITPPTNAARGEYFFLVEVSYQDTGVKTLYEKRGFTVTVH